MLSKSEVTGVKDILRIYGSLGCVHYRNDRKVEEQDSTVLTEQKRRHTRTRLRMLSGCAELRAVFNCVVCYREVLCLLTWGEDL